MKTTSTRWRNFDYWVGVELFVQNNSNISTKAHYMLLKETDSIFNAINQAVSLITKPLQFLIIVFSPPHTKWCSNHTYMFDMQDGNYDDVYNSQSWIIFMFQAKGRHLMIFLLKQKEKRIKTQYICMLMLMIHVMVKKVNIGLLINIQFLKIMSI